MIIDNQMCQLKIARHFFVVAPTNFNGIKLVFDSIFFVYFVAHNIHTLHSRLKHESLSAKKK